MLIYRKLLLRNFKNGGSKESIPIIAVTSTGIVSDHEKALETGCTGFIKKRIYPDTIISEIEQYLTNQSPEGAWMI